MTPLKYRAVLIEAVEISVALEEKYFVASLSNWTPRFSNSLTRFNPEWSSGVCCNEGFWANSLTHREPSAVWVDWIFLGDDWSTAGWFTGPPDLRVSPWGVDTTLKRKFWPLCGSRFRKNVLEPFSRNNWIDLPSSATAERMVCPSRKPNSLATSDWILMTSWLGDAELRIRDAEEMISGPCILDLAPAIQSRFSGFIPLWGVVKGSPRDC